MIGCAALLVALLAAVGVYAVMTYFKGPQNAGYRQRDSADLIPRLLPPPAA
jgi:hypothetical protein